MALFPSIFTIILLASTTFMTLDLYNSNSFNKSTTGKYLNHIGIGKHVLKLNETIKKSQFYNKYVLPYYNELIKKLSPYFKVIHKETIKYSNQISLWFKKTFPTFLQAIETKMIPMLKEHYSHFMVVTQKYWQITFTKLQEISLITGEWINQNVFTKFPRDQLMKSLTEFVTNTQKMAYNSFDYLTSQLQKFIAA